MIAFGHRLIHTLPATLKRHAAKVAVGIQRNDNPGFFGTNWFIKIVRERELVAIRRDERTRAVLICDVLPAAAIIANSVFFHEAANVVFCLKIKLCERVRKETHFLSGAVDFCSDDIRHSVYSVVAALGCVTGGGIAS